MTMVATPLVINAITGGILRIYKNGDRRVAGSLDDRGYRTLSVNGKNRSAHRVIWEHVNGDIPKGLEVDHIDGDPSNNSILNLRLVTHTQNMQNQHRPRGNNKTSGVKGVHWDKEKLRWRTHIVVNRKQVFIGRFDTIAEAQAAYQDAAARLHTHNPHARASV